MNYKLSWHDREIAALWPKGCVVVTRTPQPTGGFSYMLSLYFDPDSFLDKESKYLLVESPEQNTETTHGNNK